MVRIILIAWLLYFLLFLNKGIFAENKSYIEIVGGLEYKEANWIESILCKFGILSCITIEEYEIYSAEFLESGGIFKARKIGEKYAITLPKSYTAELLPSVGQYAIKMTLVGLGSYQHWIRGNVLEVDHDYWYDRNKNHYLQIETKIRFITGWSYIDINRVCLNIEPEGGVVPGYYSWCIDLDTPIRMYPDDIKIIRVNWPLRQFTNVLENLYADYQINKIYLYKISYDATTPTGGTTSFSCGIDVGFECLVNKTQIKYIRDGEGLGAFAIYFVYTYGNIEAEIHYFSLRYPIYNQLCPSTHATVKDPEDYSGGINVYQCVQCPPNSQAPNTIQTDTVNPYCICNPGYQNRDNPVNGDVSRVYVWDANGCEYKTYNCPPSIIITPTSQEVDPGQTAEYTVTIKNTGTDTCTYTLSANCPTGVSCTLSQYSITLSPNQQSTIILRATSNNPGTYTLYFKATEPDYDSRMASATLIVRQPPYCDVQISSDKTEITVNPGQKAVYNIYIKNIGNTECAFSISATCPQEVSCTLSQYSITLSPNQQSTITLEAVSNIEGNYSLTVEVKNQQYGIQKSLTLKLIVIPGINPPKIYTNVQSIELKEGETKTVLLTIENTGTQTATYNLTVECPTGLSCNLDKTQLTVPPKKQSSATLFITGQKVGQYYVTVIASGERGEKDSVQIFVNVTKKTPVPEPDNETKRSIPKVTITPSEISLLEGEEANISIIVSNIGNKAGEFLLEILCPEGVKCSITSERFYLEPQQSKSFTLVLTGEKEGNYNIIIRVTNDEKETKVLFVKVQRYEIWWLWILVGILVAIIIGALYFMLR